MAQKPSKAIAGMIEDEPEKTVDADKLDVIRTKAEEARELELVKADLETQLKNANIRLNKIYRSELPDLMVEAGVDTIGLPAHDNYPAMDAELKPYYSASIAASWPEERKRAAFDYLTKLKAGDLIKTEVSFAFPRGKKGEAVKFARANRKLGPDLSEKVHAGTLTSWLKEQVEVHGFTPQLDVIGGTAGNVVKLKERKE